MTNITITQGTEPSKEDPFDSVEFSSANIVLNFTENAEWATLMSAFFNALKVSDYSYLTPADAIKWAEQYMEENT